MPSLPRFLSWFAAAAAVLSLILLPGRARGEDAAAGTQPPVFAPVGFDAARARAETEKKILVLDAMASWCGPCQQMDETTWRDPAVGAWLASYAVAVQIDVDKEEELARTLRIEAMPTIVVFRDGREFDRNVGFQAAADLLGWLEGVARGENRQKTLENRLEKAKGKGREESEIRMELARVAADGGDAARATEEYAWLWEHGLQADPDFSGVRVSFMADDMRRLAEREPAAKARFRGFRDALTATIDGLKFTREQFGDWLALCQIIGDDAAVMSWFARVKENPEGNKALAGVGPELADALAARGQWAEAGRLVADPVAEVRSTLAMSKSMEKEPDFLEMLLASVGPRYAMILAAGRIVEGEAVAKEIVDSLGTDLQIRLGLIRYALEASATAPIHQKWLAEAASSGVDVSDLLGQLEHLGPLPSGSPGEAFRGPASPTAPR